MSRFAIALFGLTAAVAMGGVSACAGLDGQDGAPGEAGPPGETGPKGDPPETAPIPEAAPPPCNYPVPGDGLKLSVTATKIGADGTVTVDFGLTDATGVPLQASGVTAKFVLAWLGVDSTGGADRYTAYTTRDNTSPTTKVTEKQFDADEGGTVAEVGTSCKGTYTYTFATKIPATFDKTKTHTVAAWGFRTSGGKRWVGNSVFDFVPDGTVVKVRREVVKTDACNGCHNPLSLHDGLRRDTRMCILCHTDMKDPDSGNTLDFRAMVHSIHRGKALAGVIAGTPYQLYDADHKAEDYSTVGYPRELNHCPTCHTGAMGDVWKSRPTRLVCGSCHDGIAFVTPTPAGKKAHAGGPQSDDTKCTLCHTEKGSSLSVVDGHLAGILDAAAPVIEIKINSVEKTAPGETPIVHFSVTKDTKALDIVTTPLTTLAVTLAGPTTEYLGAPGPAPGYTRYVIQGTGATGTLAAETGGYKYTLPSAMPTSAKGSWGVAMEGYQQPDSTKPELRYSAYNPVVYVPVTDTTAVPRRTIVDTKQCVACHRDVRGHGGTRRNVEYCSFCHTPNQSNDERVARLQVPETYAATLDFKVMVHRIHMGENLTQPYVLGGFPAPSTTLPKGTPVNFGETRFPGQINACWTCHVGTSYMLPLSPAVQPSRAQILSCDDTPPLDATKYCTTRSVKSEILTPPVSAVCTACHDAPAAIAHAQVNTTPAGLEACATCHASGKTWDIQVMHAIKP